MAFALAKAGSANSQVLTARLEAANTAPSVSNVQYTTSRHSVGRGCGTRQMRSKVCSMASITSSTETSSATRPFRLSWRALPASWRRVSATAEAASGTKFWNTKSTSACVQASNTGNAARMANTTADSGTSANTVV